MWKSIKRGEWILVEKISLNISVRKNISYILHMLYYVNMLTTIF